MIIETPDWDLASVGLSEVNNKHSDELKTTASTVYEPAEDTFLMLDSLQQDLENIIRSRLLYLKADASLSTCSEPLLVVELGSGLGLLSAAVAKAIRDCDISASVGAHCVAVDVNPAACCATAHTCKLNGVMVDVVRGDLLKWMRWPESTCVNDNTNQNIYGPIDVLLFNPPYVRGPGGESAPVSTMFNTDTEDKTAFLTLMTNAAWLGGGPDGIDVLKRALHQAADLLSERGVFYILMIDYNFSALVCEEIKARYERDSHEPANDQVYQESFTNFIIFTTFGRNPKSKPLACRRLLSRSVPGERLSVYRVYRPHFLELETNNS